MQAIEQFSKSDGLEEARASELVERYEEGDALFVSPTTSVLGQNLVALPALAAGPEWQARLCRAAEDAAQRSTKLVFGAVPFDVEQGARLLAPARLARGPALTEAPRRWITSFDARCRVRPLPEPAGYERAVAAALRRIARGELSKVVLGRMLELRWEKRIEVARLVRTLLAQRRGFGFAIDLGPTESEGEGRRTLLGVSPELLLRRRGLRVCSHPLAGSAPRRTDPVEDEREAERLLSSEKDKREHALVVEAIVETLRVHCDDVEFSREPRLLRTETLWHLGTEINARLRSPQTSSLRLALALHPTPAVCGTPAKVARALIHELEPFQRGQFAGMVGWMDGAGDGEWAVTIRAAEVDGNGLRLFAGAGIVRGSSPAAELRETAVKLSTLLRVLGISGAGEEPCN